MHFFLLPEVCGFSLRTGRLLCFDRAVGHHVGDALAEVAFLRLRRELAFFGMMIQATTVVASGEKRGKQDGGESRTVIPGKL